MNRPWTENEIAFMKERYPVKGKAHCAKELDRSEIAINVKAIRLGLKAPPRGEMVQTDESLILSEYAKSFRAREVSRVTGIDLHLVSRTLDKHQVWVGPNHHIERFKDEITRDYMSEMMTNAQIGERYGVSYQVIKKWCRIWGLRAAPGRNHRIRKNGAWEMRRGENHQWYGKPPAVLAPTSSYRGKMGWYRERMFRSMMELTFMIQLDVSGREWESGECEQYAIPYQMDGRRHIYYPDFIVGDTIYEIKPTCQMNDPKVLAKKAAAEALCERTGRQYVMLDVRIDFDAVATAFDAGIVRFEDEDIRWVLKQLERARRARKI